MSIQLAVILVPVLFGFLGFALDLGRLYLIRGELNQAANSMAVQAASQLLGTTASGTNVQNALQSTNSPTYAYNFGTLAIGGGGTGNLTSTIETPTCFATVADATSGAGQSADCGSAQAVQVNLTADAPLIFFSLLPGGESRKTPIAARAVAGISAPLCTACGIVPLAIAALDSADTVNFGFDSTFSVLYTLSQSCTGTPAAINIPGTSSVGPNGLSTIPYVLINRYDASSATLDEFDQAYQSGAGGVAASTNPTPNALTANTNTPLACMNIGDTEQIWASAVPPMCARPTAQATQAMLCGIYSRIDNTTTPTACPTMVTDFDALAANSRPDTDVAANIAPPYSDYAGNGRRIITVAIVDALAANTTAPMTVLGFRQFLVVPNTDGTFFSPGDANGRFPVLYIGNPAPVQSGWFDTRYANACPVGSFSGPGKVVLH